MNEAAPVDPRGLGRKTRTKTEILGAQFAIYGEGFVKPVVQGIDNRSLRTSPSPSASVDLPCLAGTQVSSCAF
ncbi:MAG TPA: hypothetical protein VGY66_24015, partial [Gemmataceae bacterium]|nr:hypothetical protein [Gemmataceae bacterium]